MEEGPEDILKGMEKVVSTWNFILLPVPSLKVLFGIREMFLLKGVVSSNNFR